MPTGLTPASPPPAVPDFTGRVTEQNTLLTQLRDAEGRGGPAGIGKTALALRAAHTAAQHFPTVNCSFECGNLIGRPLPPSVALGSLLAPPGFRGTAIPETLADRANLYRSAMADRATSLSSPTRSWTKTKPATCSQVRPSSALLLTSAAPCLPGVEALSHSP